MRKITVLLAFLAILLHASVSTWASPVDASVARRAAENYVRLQGGKSVQLMDITATTPYRQFYVFAGADGQGFVLVSADDCVIPIIGYSATNTFETKGMPANVKDWLDDYEAQIQFYANLGNSGVRTASTSENSASAQWQNLLEGRAPTTPSNTSVSPLMSTTWNQSPLYNNLCPYDNSYGERTVTGCVATATAQVMKYWNYPTQGYGSHSYTHNTYGSQSANFGTTTYAWSSMPNALTSSSSTTQINAVATLMYHVGVAIEMDYGVSAVGGSGAQTTNYGNPDWASAENALRYYFKYKSSLYSAALADYTNAEWANLLTNELLNNRPVIYSGRDSTGGHCFVCDGVNNSGLFHFNWGWGGYCDGNYAIGSLNPAAGGTGGNATYTFNLKNYAIVGIQPNNAFGSATSVSVANNNSSLGSVTGSGSYTGTNTNLVALTATANTGCRFAGWSDGCKHNPRSFYANGGTYNFTATFEQLSGDTLGYCQDAHLLSWGYSDNQLFKWGIKIPASALSAGQQLSKVMLYVVAAGSYTLDVYEGTSSNQVYTQSFTAGSNVVGQWGTLTLNNPVAVSGNQPIWISVSCSEPYPAAITYYSGNDDSRLYGDSFTPIGGDYSFMIRGIFTTSNTVAAGDTVSYCGNGALENTIGTGSGLTWAVKFPASMLSHRAQVSAVQLYVASAGTYNLSMYRGNATSSSTLMGTQSVTYNSTQINSWNTITLNTPVDINSSDPVWIVFTSTNIGYPAACNAYSGDDNGSLLTLDDGSTWSTLYDASSGSLNGSWMIKAILSGGTANSDCSVNAYPWNDNFEGDVSCYRTLDADGDGYNWGLNEGAEYAHSGTHALYSMSYLNPNALRADNYLVTPKFSIPATGAYEFKFYARSLDASFPDSICVKAAVGSFAGASSFSTTLMPHTCVSSGTYVQYTVNLAQFAGLDIYLAIEHLSYDGYAVLVDDLSVTRVLANYTVSATANNSARGTVTGGGVYPEGSTATLTAIPNAGYRFSQWNDGNTDNPRTITVTGNAAYVADFIDNDCAVRTFPWRENFSSGDVSCWSFTPWVFTGENELSSDWNNWNVTSFQGDTNLFAVSYVFGVGGTGPVNRWIFTPAIVLSANNSYYFTYDYALRSASGTTAKLKVYVSNMPEASGAVEIASYTDNTSDQNIHWGAGSIDLSAYAGQTIYIGFRDCSTFSNTSTNKEEYVLIDNLVISQHQSCAVTVNCTGTGSGSSVRTQSPSVDLCGQTQALPAGFVATYKFLPTQGSELSHLYVNNVDRINEVQTSGSGSSSSYSLWQFTPAGNTTINPVFDLQSYTINVASMQPAMGSVTGAGTYVYGQQVTLTATPVAGHHFEGWYLEENGTRSLLGVVNPMVFVAERNATIYADFEIDTYAINITPNDVTRGSVSGSGQYQYLSTVTATATPYSGYRFAGWSNGATYNPYTFPATGDLDLVAIFLSEDDTASYLLTVTSNNPAMGTVTGGGRYAAGSSVTITATANSGYRFVSWNDGNTSASRVVLLSSDTVFTATFEAAVGIADAEPADYVVYGSTHSIVVRNAAHREVNVYDLNGRKVSYVAKAEEEQHIAIRYRGIYFVVIDRDPARKVMVR